MQGRVACEVNSGDELVATELIFAGVLAELSPEQAVALLSALVFQARSGALLLLPSVLLASDLGRAGARPGCGVALQGLLPGIPAHILPSPTCQGLRILA